MSHAACQLQEDLEHFVGPPLLTAPLAFLEYVPEAGRLLLDHQVLAEPLAAVVEHTGRDQGRVKEDHERVVAHKVKVIEMELIEEGFDARSRFRLLQFVQVQIKAIANHELSGRVDDRETTETDRFHRRLLLRLAGFEQLTVACSGRSGNPVPMTLSSICLNAFLNAVAALAPLAAEQALERLHVFVAEFYVIGQGGKEVECQSGEAQEGESD